MAPLSRRSSSYLDNIFYPRSVAIVGASEPWATWLLEFGYRGALYVVHPHQKEGVKIRVYPTLQDVPEPIDLAILTVPAPLFPEIIKGCAERSVKAITSPACGFSEAGTEEGKALEVEIVQLARELGVRIIGPNCIGIYCPDSALTFCDGMSRQGGQLGYISQSGTNATRLVRLANLRGIYFSKAIAYGNACDLGASDFIEYFMDDPETKIVAAYIEGLKEGHRFFRTVMQCVRKKPVIILKGGLTTGGSRAASSHTGSMCGSDTSWSAFFKQTGAIKADSLVDIADIVMAFLHLPSTMGRRVGIVGSGAGGGVMLADACERAGLSIPSLAADTKKELKKILPPVGSSAENPVDGGPPVPGSMVIEKGLRIISADIGIDFMMVHLNVDLAWFFDRLDQSLDQIRKRVSELVRVTRALPKPTVLVLNCTSGAEERAIFVEVQQRCLEAGLPTYTTYEGAAKSTAKFIEYHELLRSIGT